MGGKERTGGKENSGEKTIRPIFGKQKKEGIT